MKNKIFLFAAVFLLISLTASISAEESFIFRRGDTFTFELAMGNADLSPCTTCSCEYNLFYQNGTNFISGASGTNVNGYCRYQNTTDLVGKYDGEMIFNDGTDYGRVTFEFEITHSGFETPEGVPNVYAIIVLVIFLTSGFFLFLSTQLNEAGPKIFCLLSSLVFLIASLLVGNSFVQTYNVAEGLSDNISYVFYAVGLIFFVFFAYIMIRQSVAAFDAMQISRGLKMGDKPMYSSQGRTVSGYDIRKPY